MRNPGAFDYLIWDVALPGLGIRILPGGRKRYIVQYRTGRRLRRINFSPTAALPCEQARTRVMAIIVKIKGGKCRRKGRRLPRSGHGHGQAPG